MEPATDICPNIKNNVNDCCEKLNCDRTANKFNSNFLKDVSILCKKHGIVFILDEMITGFRWHLKGAQYLYGIKPDLCTFGKAMANGYSVACIAGKRDIMQLGSIEFENQERTFLLSTTHGAEMSSLGAFVETIKFMKNKSVIKHIWNYGYNLKNIFNALIKKYNLENNFFIRGPACSPTYAIVDKKGNNSLELRTLFIQEMIKNKILMPWIALCYHHGDKELKLTENALEKVLPIVRKALDGRVSDYLEGDVIKPVFRKYN